MDPTPSSQLLRQRIRNNIIAYLEVASSALEQREYERKVPIAQVPNEMIDRWEDSVQPNDFAWYSEPVFTREENQAMRDFHAIWNEVADATPNPMPYSVELLIGTPIWDRFMSAASIALDVFMRRGRLDDDVEEEL